MNLLLMRRGLASAEAAVLHNDRQDFVVGICVAQSQLGERLDLVRLLDHAVKAFPNIYAFRVACEAVAEAESLGQLAGEVQ